MSWRAGLMSARAHGGRHREHALSAARRRAYSAGGLPPARRSDRPTAHSATCTRAVPCLAREERTHAEIAPLMARCSSRVRVVRGGRVARLGNSTPPHRGARASAFGGVSSLAAAARRRAMHSDA